MSIIKIPSELCVVRPLWPKTEQDMADESHLDATETLLLKSTQRLPPQQTYIALFNNVREKIEKVA
jgi:hypothetical protein